jgi:hypothetical protein
LINILGDVGSALDERMNIGYDLGGTRYGIFDEVNRSLRGGLFVNKVNFSLFARDSLLNHSLMHDLGSMLDMDHFRGRVRLNMNDLGPSFRPDGPLTSHGNIDIRSEQLLLLSFLLVILILIDQIIIKNNIVSVEFLIIGILKFMESSFDRLKVFAELFVSLLVGLIPGFIEIISLFFFGFA